MRASRQRTGGSTACAPLGARSPALQRLGPSGTHTRSRSPTLVSVGGLAGGWSTSCGSGVSSKKASSFRCLTRWRSASISAGGRRYHRSRTSPLRLAGSICLINLPPGLTETQVPTDFHSAPVSGLAASLAPVRSSQMRNTESRTKHEQWAVPVNRKSRNTRHLCRAPRAPKPGRAGGVEPIRSEPALSEVGVFAAIYSRPGERERTRETLTSAC